MRYGEGLYGDGGYGLSGAYSTDETATALLAAVRTWDFRYARVDQTGTELAPIEASGMSVTHAALADIKRTCAGGLNPDAVFDYSSDRLRVFARLLMGDGQWFEWPLGTFLLSSATRSRGSGAPRGTVPVQGYDLLQVLKEDSLTDRYVVAAGTNYADAVRAVLAGAGFTSSLIANTALTLPAAAEWAPGTTKLQVVNDLLGAINYTTVSVTALGVPTAGPYLAPADAPVLWAYGLDSASVVQAGSTSTLDLFSVPNVVVGVVSEPDRPPLVATATNADPTSPLSTVRRGRKIVSLLETTNAAPADLTTLQAQVDRALAQAGQVYETLAFSTGLMPVHTDQDVVTFDDGKGGGPVRYRETDWSMELRAGGTMTHSVRRVVIVG